MSLYSEIDETDHEKTIKSRHFYYSRSTALVIFDTLNYD